MTQAERELVQYLGGVKLIGIKDPESPIEFHMAVSRGLPAKCVFHLKSQSGLTTIQVTRILGISAKTFSRWQGSPKGSIGLVSSDRLVRAAKVFALAEEVLEDKEAARAWLNEPQRALGDQTPVELLTTDIGARQVEELLLRMEHGFLA